MAKTGTKAKAGNDPGSVLLIGAMFLAFGLFGLACFGWAGYRTWTAQSWPLVPCRILSADVVSRRSGGGPKHGGGTSWSLEVSYLYRIGGREYRSERYEFANLSTGGQCGKAAAARKLRNRPDTFCRVNPADPEDAVLSTEISGGYWFALIFLVPVALGTAVIVYSLRRLRTAGNAAGPPEEGK